MGASCSEFDGTGNRLTEMRTRLGRGEAAAIRHIAHSLKSSSAMIGLSRLAEVAKEMEKVAAGGDIERLCPLQEAAEAALQDAAEKASSCSTSFPNLSISRVCGPRSRGRAKPAGWSGGRKARVRPTARDAEFGSKSCRARTAARHPGCLLAGGFLRRGPRSHPESPAMSRYCRRCNPMVAAFDRRLNRHVKGSTGAEQALNRQEQAGGDGTWRPARPGCKTKRSASRSPAAQRLKGRSAVAGALRPGTGSDWLAVEGRPPEAPRKLWAEQPNVAAGRRQIGRSTPFLAPETRDDTPHPSARSLQKLTRENGAAPAPRI